MDAMKNQEISENLTKILLGFGWTFQLDNDQNLQLLKINGSVPTESNLRLSSQSLDLNPTGVLNWD